MALVRRFLFLFLAAALAGFASAFSSPFMSDSVFQASTGSTRRNLLQAKDDCPVSFESQNYTIITSKCKAPKFPPTECCDAFKKFACPFATYLNNGSTNCAETMLTYINVHGSYPAGLFSAQCLKGKEGVSCEGIPGIDTGVPSGGGRAHGWGPPRKDCPMDFGYQNYTVITSRCKAPQYPPTECCDAFRDFACPFAVYINNKSTNCANTMISNINFMGKYPEGLLAAECLKGKEGVYCEGVQGMDTGVSIGHNSHKRALRITAVAAPLLLIFTCFICCIVWMRRRRKGKANLHHQAAMDRTKEDALVWRLEEKSSAEFTLFDFSEILHATNNFSREALLGQGGFGPVYKGQLLDGMEIAVKRLASHSAQGFTEFKNEVELIAKLQHNNLVKLMGCCIQGDEKLLVYEYLPNKSLDFFIFDESRTTLVDWNKRCVIIEGIAQGLMYLHKHSRLRIIHRDLKASNILLDLDMNPKISDFGLAKIFSSNDTQGTTKRVVGTYGYMSPEYASQGIYSVKSDVFSFGVLLLEILSGKRNSGFHEHEEFINLLGYSWQLWEGGRCLELLEASVANEVHAAEARRCINIALLCVQEHADDRPTMSNVVTMLNSESVVLPKPNHPAYFNLMASKEDELAPCSYNGVTITEEPDGR